MKHYLPVIMLMILLCGRLSFAGEGMSKRLALNECITIALQNNSDIKASEEDKKKALAEYRVAVAQRNVSIDLSLRTNQYPKTTESESYIDRIEKLQAAGSAGIISTGESSAWQWYVTRRYNKSKTWLEKTLSNYYNIGATTSVSASISLYNDKKAKYAEMSKTGMKIANLQGRKVMNEVILNVKKAYYSYIMARENIELRKKTISSNEDRVKITEILFKNGTRGTYDLNKARYDLNDAKLELQKAGNNERTAKAELFRIMGIADPGFELNLDKIENVPEVRYSLDELLRYGELNYPDLLVVRAQKETNRIKIAFERAGHLPEVDIQAAAGFEDGDLFSTDYKKIIKPSFAIGFMARLPIYSGGAVNARIDSARAEYNKMIYKEKDAVMLMKTSLDSSMTMLQELQKQIEMSAMMVENAERNLALAQKSYQNGLTTQIELHDASDAVINSRIGLMKVKYDYLITIAKLSVIVGLGEDSLCKK